MNISRRAVTLTCCLLFPIGMALSQLMPPLAQPAPTPSAAGAELAWKDPHHPHSDQPLAENENPDDPAYAMYKKGYDLILEEKWADALKHFAEFRKKYPKSSYRADAEYWSAFALKHTDSRKAEDAYENFIRKYSSSSYLDDAIADLASLRALAAIPRIHSVPPDSAWPDIRMPIAPDAVVGPWGRDQRTMEFSLQRMARNMRRAFRSIGPGGEYYLLAPGQRRGETLDRETRLKIAALTALGESNQDEKSFETFKGIALDRRQVPPLRLTAMQSLRHFKKHDVLPVFEEIALRDTSEAIQSSAIYCIGDAGGDRDRSFEILSKIFEETPKGKTEELQTILDAITDVASEKSLVFLSHVARTQENDEIRGSAIECIGQLGVEKNKSMDILKDLYTTFPKDGTEQRRAILYSAAEIGNDRAVDFLISVARTDDSDELRSEAISQLGAIGGEKARGALYQILQEK